MYYIFKIYENNTIFVLHVIFFLNLMIMLFLLNRPIIEGLKKPKLPKKPKAPNIGKIIRDIGKMGKTINGLIKKIGSIEKKIKNIFTQIPKVLNNSIVKPFLALFTGLGNVFVQLYNILKKIGYKIVSLPGCILYFIIGTTTSAVMRFISWLTPGWIERPISTIWKATFGKLLSWILKWIGYTDASRKCYAFNVDQEIDKMRNGFKKTAKAFKKGFGKVKFKI